MTKNTKNNIDMVSKAGIAKATIEKLRKAVEECTEEEKASIRPLLIAIRDDLKERRANEKPITVWIDNPEHIEDGDVMKHIKNKVAASLTDPRFRPKTFVDKKKEWNKKKARGRVDAGE